MDESRAVIFDLDGTLTVPTLDFDLIRREIGGVEGPILEAMESLDPVRRAAAEAILEKHEGQAARDAVPRNGAVATVESLRNTGWRVGVLTRNARCWTRVVLDRCRLTVDAVRCRDDGPVKPDPVGVITLCEEMNVDSRSSWMVGDHRFDIEAGRTAGLTTVLIVDKATRPAFAAEASYVIECLTELPALLGG